jgi:two-component system KDP operon response regulator KdpE
MSNPVILLVDVEGEELQVLRESLSVSGYEVHTVQAGERALLLASIIEAQVVILDIALMDVDRLALCRALCQRLRTSVIVLSSDEREESKIDALDAGADDYLAKPYSLAELHARLRRALRHLQLVAALHLDLPIQFGDLRVDVEAHTAWLGETRLTLTAKEFALLVLLARNAGKVVSHSSLLACAWTSGDGGMDSLRVHVSQLRRKLGSGSRRPVIQTEVGLGYRLILPRLP